MKGIVICCCIYGVLATVSSYAGQIKEAMLFGAVQQFLDKGQPSACGVRIIAMETFNPKVDMVLYVHDGSILVHKNVGGSVKALLTTTTTSQVLSKQQASTPNIPLTRSWFKAPRTAATQVIKDVPSETESALFYATEFANSLAVIDSALSGEPIQIGFQERGRDIETILFGSVVMSDAEKGQLLNCLQELVGSMKTDLRVKTNKKKP